MARGGLTQRLYGPPPPVGAPRSQVLRWFRKTSWWGAPVTVILLVLSLLAHQSAWVSVALAVFAATSLANLIALTVRIRRAERAEAAAADGDDGGAASGPPHTGG
jgi:hypothetical protein